MPVVSAAGRCGLLLVVVKVSQIPYRKILQNRMVIQEALIGSLPRDAVIAMLCDTNGVDSVNVKAWAQKVFEHVYFLTAQGLEIRILYDSYGTHILLEVLKSLNQNNIVVYKLPADTSVKTQSLAAVTFLSSKSHFNRISADITLRSRRTSF